MKRMTKYVLGGGLLATALGLFFKITGCKHRKYSQPFWDDKQKDTYIRCLDCGHRRSWDYESWSPYGPWEVEDLPEYKDVLVMPVKSHLLGKRWEPKARFKTAGV